MNIEISTRHNVAVDQNYFWNMDMTACPLHTKVQLYGKGGLPQYGYYDGKNPFWVGWAPLPKVKTAECDGQTELHKFYGVITDGELIAAQAHHVEKLQSKLNAAPSFAFQRPRGGA